MANPILKQIDDLARNYADLFEKIGAPKSTVEKIRSGELPMDEASRMQRAIEQGYDPKVTYHHGRKGITEFRIPTDGRNYKYGPAVYSSPKRGYGEPYLRANKISDEDAKIYELMSRGKIASTDKVSDQHFDARNMAFDIADQEGRDSNPNDYWRAMHQILQDKGYTGLDIMKERAVFDPANVRYKGAAFDPDQVGNPNIFASTAPVAAGGILGALGLPEDATAADIATAGMTVAPKEEAQAETQQMILDALLGFMAPTPLGDATMDAYNKRKAK
jgi:hypothetical protein